MGLCQSRKSGLYLDLQQVELFPFQLQNTQIHLYRERETVCGLGSAGWVSKQEGTRAAAAGPPPHTIKLQTTPAQL